MVWSYVDKYHFDKALRERDFVFLTDAVRHGADMPPEVREYLAEILLNLLTRKVKFPRHRPAKEATINEGRKIALRVLELAKEEGGVKLIAAVKQTSVDFECSERKVYNWLKVYRAEKRALEEELLGEAMLDAMRDAAYEDYEKWLASEDGSDDVSFEEWAGGECSGDDDGDGKAWFDALLDAAHADSEKK